MKLLTCLCRRLAVSLIVTAVTASLAGAVAYAQHLQHGSLVANGGAAWSELQRSMQVMHEAMQSLISTGDQDADFVRLMLPHHQAALEMAKVELIHGKNSQMRRLAQEIVADQQSEIDLMQLWLTQHNVQNTQPATSAAKEH